MPRRDNMTKYVYKNEELIRLAREGDLEAEEELFRVNDGFCHKLTNKFSNTNIEYDDLLGLARIGLVKAYKKYTFSKNNKFLTFASKVMDNEILMQVRKNKKHKETFNLEHIVNTD
jgi:RNA polymerase sporulation-specific sigma factor